MTKLSVNVNKVAWLRNAREKNLPNVVSVALDCIKFGADGITVHPRPDGRHIRRHDVYDLKAAIDVELNVEGYPSEDFIRMVEEVKPAQCTLVPDAPDTLTSNAGWDTLKYKQSLFNIVYRLKQAGIRTSLFMETDLERIEAAREIGVDRIELYTENYSDGYAKNREEAIEPYVRAAQFAQALGLGINAGHDLNLHNLSFLHQQIPFMDEVSIGHALICDALYLGLEDTIRRYQTCLGK